MVRKGENVAPVSRGVCGREEQDSRRTADCHNIASPPLTTALAEELLPEQEQGGRLCRRSGQEEEEEEGRLTQ